MTDNPKCHEGHGQGYVILQQKRTLKEVLEIATSFEKTAHEFYSQLIPKAGKNIQYLLEDLAAEELQHYHLFLDLLDDPSVLKQIQQKIAKPREENRYMEYVHTPELGDNPDEITILRYAIGREEAALKQYQELADNAPEGPLKSVFQFLAYEEAEHRADLEKIYKRINTDT